MTLAILSNIATAIFCAAVLVQSVRMMRSLKAMNDGTLAQVVSALDKSTAQARVVLSDMKQTLAGDCAANARVVEEARTLREELAIIIGIADAAAERIAGAAASNTPPPRPRRPSRAKARLQALAEAGAKAELEPTG